MLPKQHKFTSPAEFSRTIKRGRRAGSRTVVVHLLDRSSRSDADIAVTGGPRVGLIVSKAVGNAVIRHRTSRRLRHVCAALIDAPSPTMPRTCDVVIRALPAAGTASTSELTRDIRKALRKVGVPDER